MLSSPDVSPRGVNEPAWAHFGGVLATGLMDVTDDLSALNGPGWWAVVLTYEGRVTCARFSDVRAAALPDPMTPWAPQPLVWATSLDRAAYLAAVEAVRSAVAEGEVYQANICRVLSSPLAGDVDLADLARRLAAGNPAPYAGVVNLPDHGVQVVTASPELFLSRHGDIVESHPIKGTAVSAATMLPKDEAENVMIVDLVRNDLGRVCEVGTVTVPDLLAVEEHPGLVHLVSRVRGQLREEVGWAELIEATFPPGSVTGAPKSTAVRIIDTLENAPRGPYCGAVGWVDGDTRTASLAVGIRTFWLEDGMLNFGTGAGITWGSDPVHEWDETELKAARLVGIAEGPAGERESV